MLSCRWVQAECRKLGDTDNPEVSELLKTAVSYLKERPVLFKYCAEEVTFCCSILVISGDMLGASIVSLVS